MGRQAKFGRSELAAAALRIVADGGPQALTMGALAKEVGAPTGSIYHRYESRAELLGELWMDVVESFQAGFAAALAEARDADGAVTAARFMLGWTREHPLEARLLLSHGRRDFVAGEFPRALVERAAALEPQLGAALRSFARRAYGRVDADTLLRLRFALLDAPFGGIKPYVQSRKPLPRALDGLVEATVRAALATIDGAPGEEKAP